MKKSTLRLGLAALAAAGLAGSSLAKTVTMTPTTITAALAALAPGDTLRLEGNFTNILSIQNRDFGGVRVDASGATLLEGMALTNVHNIAFTGGTWGRTDRDTSNWSVVSMINTSHVSFAGAVVLGNANNRGAGLGIRGSSFITVRDNDFIGHLNSMGVRESVDSLITNNKFTASRSDGLQMQANQRMIVSENRCSGFNPFSGAHPDCVQMWTPHGTVLQSDIYILNNYAEGMTQAFASFDPKDNSGTRLTFAGNYAAVTYSHGVSCYGCSDSVMVDNMFVTPFGAMHRVTIRQPNGTNNFIANNQSFNFQNNADAIFPEHILSNLVPTLAGLVGSMHESRSYRRNIGLVSANFGSLSDDPVPEPATWLMLLSGFVLVGRQLRQARGPARVLA